MYSVQGGLVRPKFSNLSVAEMRNFVYFSQANLDISASLDLQADLIENVLVVFHQMYICFCNYKKHKAQNPVEGTRARS